MRLSGRALSHTVIWTISWLLLASVTVGAESSDGATTVDAIIASPELDWPQWRGPRRDGICAERGLLHVWPEGGPKQLWKTEQLGKGWSSPIVVGDSLYITGDVDDDLIVYALDRDGNVQWKTTNGKSWTGSYPGARASCTYSAGRLYHLNAHGRLACLDAAQGDELWAVNVLDRFGGKNITWALSESVLIDGQRVVVTPGGSKALMAALDKQNGQTIWTTPPLGADRASHSSPLLFQFAGHRQIANCSSAHGFGVDAETGRLLWTVPLKNQYGVNTASPVYGGGSVFFVTPYAEEGRAYRLEASQQGLTAQLAWSSPLDTVTGCAILIGDTLYAAGYRKSKWWFGLDWRTGQVKCEQKELTTGASVYADGHLYCLDERGKVGLLKPKTNELEVKGQFQLIEDRVRDAWAHPVVHDGRLYLRYHDALYCYDVKNR